MADNADDKPTAAKASTKADDDNAMETMQKQIAQMRREISSLKRALTEQAEEVEGAEGWFDTASQGASRATQALRTKAQTVSGVVQGNPGTVTSALLVGGIIGLFVGLALGRSEPVHRRWY